MSDVVEESSHPNRFSPIVFIIAILLEGSENLCGFVETLNTVSTAGMGSGRIDEISESKLFEVK